MSRNLQKLEAEALKLPVAARDRLAARLLESLEPRSKAPPGRVTAPPEESRWAALARRYRESPCLEGSSEKVNALLREFREELVL